MAHSRDQWNTSDTIQILSDDTSSDSFDPSISKRSSYYEPSEDCLPYLTGDPIFVHSKTPRPHHGEQSIQSISAYDQENSRDRMKIHSDDSHINLSTPEYLNHSFDYRDITAFPIFTMVLSGFPLNHHPATTDGQLFRGNRATPILIPSLTACHSNRRQCSSGHRWYTLLPNRLRVVKNCNLRGSLNGAIALAIIAKMFCLMMGIIALVMASE